VNVTFFFWDGVKVVVGHVASWEEREETAHSVCSDPTLAVVGDGSEEGIEDCLKFAKRVLDDQVGRRYLQPHPQPRIL